VRFNDFLFAAHGAAMCVIIYSQFFPRIWGFKVGRTQSVSRMVLAIFWGLVLGVVIVACMAMSFGRDGGYDASGWAWIDVVSTSGFSGDSCFRDARAAICSPTSGTPQ
jgi:cystinosin